MARAMSLAGVALCVLPALAGCGGSGKWIAYPGYGVTTDGIPREAVYAVALKEAREAAVVAMMDSGFSMDARADQGPVNGAG